MSDPARLPGSGRWPCLRRCGFWSLLVIFLPLLVVIGFMPMFWWYDCGGNEGTGIRCTGAPWLNETASTIMIGGIWGLLLSAMAGFFLFCAGMLYCLIRHRRR